MPRPSELPVTAAVVSYNTRDHLARCLTSLAREPISEIIVVDNASADGSCELVRRRFPHVRLIANEANPGYGAAANQALREAGTPLVLILNADTEVKPGSVAALCSQLAAEPRTAIAAPRLETLDGVRQPSCFPFPGTFGWLLENEPLSFFVRRLPFARERSISFSTAPSTRTVPWVLGAALLVRRDAVLALDGFDESFFMYYEEVDLCRRLAQAGWATQYVPDSVVLHVGGASTSQVAEAMRVQRFRSTMVYYRRHHAGGRRAFWTTLVRLKRGAQLARYAAMRWVEMGRTRAVHAATGGSSGVSLSTDGHRPHRASPVRPSRAVLVEKEWEAGSAAREERVQPEEAETEHPS